MDFTGYVIGELVERLGYSGVDMLNLIFALAATTVALTAIFKFPPFRRPLLWLWRTNIADPSGQWVRAIIREEATAVIKSELATVAESNDRFLRLYEYTHDNVHDLREYLTPVLGHIDIMWAEYMAQHPDIEDKP